MAFDEGCGNELLTAEIAENGDKGRREKTGAKGDEVTAVRIGIMPGRAIRVTSRIAFLFCGLISLFTAVPYVMLRGVDLPVQSEWILFVVALGLVGVFSVALAVLPRSWIAKVCKKDRDDDQLFFSAPETARRLRGDFISRGARRLSRSAPLESRSPTHVFAVSDVFLKADVRSLAGDSLFPACPHERGSVRLTRPHPGMRMVGVP